MPYAKPINASYAKVGSCREMMGHVGNIGQLLRLRQVKTTPTCTNSPFRGLFGTAATHMALCGQGRFTQCVQTKSNLSQ